jgi:hypothetical protein
MTYTAEQLWNKYNKSSKDQKIEILNGALSIMQQYNGRSKTYCIFRAMGYETEDTNTYYKV